MRHLLKFALACALFCVTTAAHAQPFSKSTLTTQLPQFFPDNTTNFITPALLRSWLTGAIESWQQYAGVNAQTGTTYTIVGSDYGQYVSFNNSSAVAVTLPAATAAAGFYPFSFYATNVGAGTATLTPTSGTINGASSLALLQNQSVFVVADGTNWQVVKLAGSIASAIAPGSTLITGATAPCVIVNSSSTTMGCIDLTNSYLAAGTFSNITGVGTVTAGTWQATTIATGFGGTGATALGSTFSNGGGTLNVATCTAAQLGACSPDNTTITASNGVLTAVGAAANAIDAGGGTSITNGVNNDVLYDNSGKVGVKVLNNQSTSVPSPCDIISTSATTCNNGGSAANNGTYTVPSGAAWLDVTECGGGGGGGGATANNGGTGGTTSFNSWTAIGGGGGGGNAGSGGSGGTGGANGTGTLIYRIAGGVGGGGQNSSDSSLLLGGGNGADGACGNGGVGFTAQQATGGSPPNGTGSGGGGGGGNTSTNTGGGGGAGEYVRFIIPTPSGTYSYSIGAGGTNGAAGTHAGGTGAGGRITVIAHFNN